MNICCLNFSATKMFRSARISSHKYPFKSPRNNLAKQKTIFQVFCSNFSSGASVKKVKEEKRVMEGKEWNIYRRK